jgi:hypothetical protein
MNYLEFRGSETVEPPGSIATLLLHFDGENNSTSFIDSSANAFAMTAVGDAKISTADFVSGGASGVFDGNGDRVESPASELLKINGDFTVEGWFKVDALDVPGIGLIFNLTDIPSNQQAFISANTAGAVLSRGGNSSNGAITAGVWYYVALTKEGDTWRLFLNGVHVSTSIVSFTHGSNAAAYYAGGPTFISIKGRLDEWRITNGVALYTASFTPPTPPLT